jgi:hypothetical protein
VRSRSLSDSTRAHDCESAQHLPDPLPQIRLTTTRRATPRKKWSERSCWASPRTSTEKSVRQPGLAVLENRGLEANALYRVRSGSLSLGVSGPNDNGSLDVSWEASVVAGADRQVHGRGVGRSELGGLCEGTIAVDGERDTEVYGERVARFEHGIEIDGHRLWGRPEQLRRFAAPDHSVTRRDRRLWHAFRSAEDREHLVTAAFGRYV